MKELFLYRIKKAEKPSKFEKKLRKVAMWLVIDVVVIAVAVTLFQEALNSSYHVEITRWDASQEPELGKLMADPQGEGDDGVSVEEGEVSPDPLLTIKKVAEEEGVDWKVLYAIGQKESQYHPNRVGDTHLKNASYGYFQINRGYHPTVTIEQANDLEWSARWTAKRLKKNEWRGEAEMIRSHNGLVADYSNKWYVDDVIQIIASL